MADQSEKTPTRSQAAKDQSRQQSRSVSGKQGAPAKGGKGQGQSPKQAGNRPASGKTANGARPAGGKPGTKGAGGGKGGGGGNRNAGSGGNRNAGPPRSTAPFIWGAVALVLVIVLVLVLVAVSGGNSGGSNAAAPITPASSTLVKQVTTIPTSVYDQVGINSPASTVSPPQPVTGRPPLKFDGKPGILYFGAEYCPYCAAERWGIVTSMARFGTWSGLQITKSSSRDAYPSTHTFTFRSASLTSPYVTLKAIEHQTGQFSTSLGNYTLLQSATKSEAKLISQLNSQGSYPFLDFGNKFSITSASYLPTILSGLNWEQIGSNLNDPTNPVTQTILSLSNYMSAATCASTGGQPGAVCHSKGVEAAATAIGAKY
jgi:hypothetical protein